jgi:hypothetical protein
MSAVAVGLSNFVENQVKVVNREKDWNLPLPMLPVLPVVLVWGLFVVILGY